MSDLNEYIIIYKNGNTLHTKAYCMELKDGTLYQCTKALIGDQGIPGTIPGDLIKSVICVARNNHIDDGAIKYQVEYFDPENGATSPIDTIEGSGDVTADDYIKCCEIAGSDILDMRGRGEVTLMEVNA